MKYIITVTKNREIIKQAELTATQVKKEVKNMEIMGYTMVDNGRGKGIVTDGKNRGRTWRWVTPSGDVKIINIKKA